MNYTKPKVIVDYMQEGGQIDPMQAIEQLVMAAMNNDQSAIQQINEIMQRAQQGDPEAQKAASLIQQMMEQTQSMKCGGKTKKAKKAQMGLPIKKCPCQLKRIGGRIVEVDGCTGLPYKKNGGNIQYARDGVYFRNPFSSWQEFQGQFVYPVKLAYNFGKRIYRWMESDPNNNPQPVAKQTPDATRTKTQEEVDKMISDSREGVKKLQENQQVTPEEPAEKAQQEPPKQPSTYKGYFAENGLGEYQSWQARKQFINDNKQWLTDQGFNVNGYTGRPEQNAQLLKMLQLYKNQPAVNDVATDVTYVTPESELPEITVTTSKPRIFTVPSVDDIARQATASRFGSLYKPYR